MAPALRRAESEVELTFAFALGVVPLVGELPGAEQRELGCERGVCEELVAWSLEVDAERKLLYSLGYGEGRDSERDAWVGLLVEMGARVRGRTQL